MSAEHLSHDTHGHDSHGHEGHGHTHGHDHGSFKSYMTGFILSVILTAIPFWLVMGDVLDNPRYTAFIILGFAVVQILVHMKYFLHMSTSAEEGWTLISTIFTITLVVITLAGSFWVIFHLNRNMMPGMQMEEPFERR